MPASFDLPGYLARIRLPVDTPLPPTRGTLAAILTAHMATVPFENFDVLLGRPVRLDLASLQSKLVGARRGGYCFEHSTLLAAALGALGFHPVTCSARDD
jgi:N-hydroxyarylamine O-acetyltransferase